MTRFIKDRGSTVKGLHNKGFRLPAGTTAQRVSPAGTKAAGTTGVRHCGITTDEYRHPGQGRSDPAVRSGLAGSCRLPGGTRGQPLSGAAP